MPSVEGLTPEILWYTLIGLVGIGAIIVLTDKVLDVFRKRKKRAESTDELAETVSQKVLEKLEPRFAEIDRKLANDKTAIESNTRDIAGHNAQLGAIESGNRVLCRGILALLSHELNGNSDDKMKASQQEIMDYLIDK